MKRRLNNTTNIEILLNEIFSDGLTDDVAGCDDVFSLIKRNTEPEARSAAALGVLAEIRVRTGLAPSQDSHSLLSLQPGTEAVEVGPSGVGEPEEISSARISNSPVWLQLAENSKSCLHPVFVSLYGGGEVCTEGSTLEQIGDEARHEVVLTATRQQNSTLLQSGDQAGGGLQPAKSDPGAENLGESSVRNDISSPVNTLQSHCWLGGVRQQVIDVITYHQNFVSSRYFNDS